MNTFRVLLLTLIATAGIWGCSKDEPSTGPAPTSAPDEPVFQAFFEANVADATQNFTVSAATGGEVIGTSGTRLIFEPGAFLYANGSPVTGSVNVTLVEVLGIGDMIWLNKQTVGNDNGTRRMLRSGGAMNITATQGGNTLRIGQGGLTVQVPTEVGDPSMELFAGVEDENGNMVWNRMDSSVVSVVIDYVDLTYNFTADSLMWINCDYFFSYPNITPLSATIPDGQPVDSTQVWIAFPSENSVVTLYPTGGQVFGTGFGFEVPVGMQAVIVGLRASTNGFYSSFTPITITANMNVPLTFTPTTIPDFQAAVNGL
jgi:hypothetical protein